MKRCWSLMVVLALSVWNSLSSAAVTPIRDTRELLVPGEFRTSDEAVVLLDGYIGDSCQKLLTPEVKVDLAGQRITITPLTARVGTHCREIYLRYTQSVSLGRLPQGHYLVETYDGKLSRTLVINEAE